MTASRTFDIPTFDRSFFESKRRISRIGSGASGGKASSLCFADSGILSRIDESGFTGFVVDVPSMVVILADVFDAFMDHGNLHSIALSDAPDDRIAHAFQKCDLPAQHVGDLLALVSQAHTPLAVRSSSLLEDHLDHPFAGVYATKMIPNNQPDVQTRFRRLVEAIKYVYASTFFRSAKTYSESVRCRIEEEKMAVIIQEVVGQRRGDRFYPCVSGVARSFNYYPVGAAKPEEGVVSLALGLGKSIVDGDRSWTYCPARPRKPPPFSSARDLLKSTQNRFWAVWMGTPPLPDPIRETEYLVQSGFAEAEADDALRFVASTYDASSDRLLPGIGTKGPRALDFARILAFEDVPLNDVVRQVMAASEDACGIPVEVEFAVNLHPRRGLPARFGFLQVRPMAVSEDHVDLTADDLTGDDVVLSSKSVMGNGRRQGIRDVVFLKPDCFDAAATTRMASEVQVIDRALRKDGRPYLLIGFGRWGTADPWLGVPADWTQICGAGVIVEASLPNMAPDPSQGSHFFQNMIALGVLYMSVPPTGEDSVDWIWLNEQECIVEGPFVKHVLTARPLDIVVDGRSRRGVVKRHE